MSKIIKLKRGFDIKLVGEAERKRIKTSLGQSYGVSPLDFRGITARLLVNEGDRVEAGEALFFDKAKPEVIFTSPVSGVVEAIVRGEKRKILDVVVKADAQGEQKIKAFDIKPIESARREDVVKTLLETGLWTYLVQRPYGVVANPNDTPKAIFVSGFDSSPLAPDLNFILEEEMDELQVGFNALCKLTEGEVHLGLKAGDKGRLVEMKGVEITRFRGAHPAGNVGVQIHHVDPINKGEVVWTIDIQSVAVIGRLFKSTKFSTQRTYAITGSEVKEPLYLKAVAGASLEELLRGKIKEQKEGDSVRIINGNVLTGRKSLLSEHLSWRGNQLTIIQEGDKYEFAGWAMPRFNKLSVSRTYFSWLIPNKKYKLDTNLNGGQRAFIFTGLFEKYLPMDIYPLHLLKAILAKDIERMENLGIYEVIEEDFALCEFVDPSKNDIQNIIQEGIDVMIKELS